VELDLERCSGEMTVARGEARPAEAGWAGSSVASATTKAITTTRAERLLRDEVICCSLLLTPESAPSVPADTVGSSRVAWGCSFRPAGHGDE
jgi:hypothetical protein